MTALLPSPELQFLDENGDPYEGGTLAFFIPGTLTPKATWQDAGQVTLNTNPIVLDMAGRCIVYGQGDYRAQLRDQDGDLIFDQLTTSSLNESAVSAAMLPVLGAADLTTARNLMGVTAAIAAAVAAVQLIPGPTGATGPTGTTGATGPTGPAGSATAASTSGSGNPGFWKDTASGFIIGFGTCSAGGGSATQVTFAAPYVGTPVVVCSPCNNAINLVTRVVGTTSTGFQTAAEDTDNHGLYAGPITWISAGI